jgi:hypothetical protein
MYKYIVAALLVAFVPTACLAGGEFYVAQDASTKKCKVVDEKPDGVKLVMIGTSTYPTRAEAKTAKKASTECNAPEPAAAPETK